MKNIRYTLVADGTFDKSLMPILNWILRETAPAVAIQDQWADLGRLSPQRSGLAEKIRIAIELYPCDLLFVHRDAEKEALDVRRSEIRMEVEKAAQEIEIPTVVCVVPVRMTEAWLLFNEVAIRRAAGNPNGKMPLNRPGLSKIESHPDPKRTLHELLKEASGLGAYRRQKFNVETAVKQISASIDNFSPLRSLSAFQRLEQDIEMALEELMQMRNHAQEQQIDKW